jgi:quinoprotein glucose dehydrogenase
MRKLHSAALAALLALPSAAGAQGDNPVWDSFGGNAGAQKFSPATQITPQNVGKLKVAWSIHTGDGIHTRTNWGATPLFVNNTVYVATPTYRLYAVEPDTGKTKWVFTAKNAGAPGGYKSRGASYWQAANPQPGQPCQKILYFGVHGTLNAVDADTGKACEGFGNHGVLNVEQWNTVNRVWPISLTQPPTVAGDTLVIGYSGVDWQYKVATPGWVWGVDARTGKLKWTFNSIPKDMLNQTGTANVWASMSYDPKSGLVYLPVSSPSPNYYGAARLKEMPLVTSVTALHADTGAVAWSRQLVHHDIWDLDTNSAATLVDIHKGGHVIPALVQATKQGFLFVLNRLTGAPVYPIEERHYPASDVPGEKASPTQPYVPVPAPTVPDRTPAISPLADLISFGSCSKRLAELRDDGRFTPPSVRGSVAFPGTVGGVEWGGGAVDPRSQTYVVNSSLVVETYTLIPRAEYNALVKKEGKAKAGSAQAGSPYAFKIDYLLNKWGMPCWTPPYGTLSSYDLKTGKLLWRKPFGQVQKWGFYMPESWGSPTIGAPVITAGGLIFIGASMDSRVRAIDLKTGKVLWKHLVEAPANSTPAVYTYKGKQYVVFAAGGNPILTPRTSDQLVAFALPD